MFVLFLVFILVAGLKNNQYLCSVTGDYDSSDGVVDQLIRERHDPATCSFNPNSVITCVCGLDISYRVTGGSISSLQSHPWTVGIYFKNGQHPRCAGTILNKYWILTAAHCFYQSGLLSSGWDKYSVRLGDYDLEVKELNQHDIPISSVKVHPKFNHADQVNDLALVKVTTPIKLSFLVQPVCLPFKLRGCRFTGMNVTITGWGYRKYTGGYIDTLPTRLVHARIPVIDDWECADRMRKWHNPDTLCTYYPGIGICDGDSGGPALLYKRDYVFIVGVASYGKDCGLSTPTVFTRVTSYLDWIEEVTGGDFCHP